MMQHAGSFRKIAFLAGLTALIGGAEISQSNATTLTTPPQNMGFDISATNGSPGAKTLTFNDFHPSLGTLTALQFGLNSMITNVVDDPTLTASVTIDSVLIGQSTSLGSFIIPVTNETSPTILGYVTGTSTFDVNLSLSVSCDGCDIDWDPPQQGVTIDFLYTTTPLPAALPLFTTGLLGLGFTTLRSRRKHKAAKQS
jgi:hypothetical protein